MVQISSKNIKLEKSVNYVLVINTGSGTVS